MSVKTVSGARATTVILDDEVLTVDFEHHYMYFAVRNDGTSNICISTTNKNASAGEDDVISVPSGTSYVHYNGYGNNSEVYLSGKGTVTVIAQDDGKNPFKTVGKGGESGGNKLLLETRWYMGFPEGLESNSYSTVIDTGIPQSNFVDKPLTVVFKINANGWQSCNGLLGYGSGTGTLLSTGLGIQVSGNLEEGIYNAGTYHQCYINLDDLTDTIGQTSVYIFADKPDDAYVMINGQEKAVQLDVSDYSFNPYGNLMMLRSGNISGIRSFDGIVYNMMIFDQFLSREEAVRITEELLGK